MNTELIKHPATLVWALLMIATALSWWLGADGGAVKSLSIPTLTVALMVIAFIKVRFVIHYFMEIRHAPLALRLVCDTWVVGICGAILILYWFSPAS
jgi:heme/copper-type cytochrome/quinol oxidase subunit 4